MNKKALVVLLLFLSMSSQWINPQSKTKALPVIDISKKYPKKEILLQDVADVEHIRLETTDDVLLCYNSGNDISVLASVSDKYICTYEWRRGNIFVFDRNGKIAYHFNHKGGSGREYPLIGPAGVIVDAKSEEIFVCAIKNIQVYSMSGAYKRTLNFESIRYSEIYNFDDETLLIYDDINVQADDVKPEKNPYRLISKKDGSTVAVLDINLPKRYSTSIYENEWIHKLFFKNEKYHGRDIVIADISSDTIYMLTQNRELTPLLVRKPSVHASEPRQVWSVFLITDKFIMVGINTLTFSKFENREIPSKVLTYEFETGEISDMTIRNTAEYVKGVGWGVQRAPVNIEKNMTACLQSVPHLKENASKKMLRGEFEKFVAKLDEEDNPIVTVIKFK